MNERNRFLVATLACAVNGAALAASVNDPPNDSHPVDVDGIASANEYGGSTPLGYVSGSLYRANIGDPLLNSTMVHVIGHETRLSTDWALFANFSFMRRTALGFANGEFIADIKFPVTIAGVDYPGFKLQIRGTGTAACAAFADLDGNGTAEAPASTYGLKAAMRLGTTSVLGGIPHLQVEIKVPLLIPRFFGRPFPNRGIDGIYKPASADWYTTAATDAGIGEQSSARVTINPGAILNGNTDTLPIHASIDVKPGNYPNIINFTHEGILKVAVITDFGLDATKVDWPTLRIGDIDLAGRLLPLRANLNDVNGDGRLDMVVFFDMSSPQAALSLSTTTLLMTGKTVAGDDIGGKDKVTVIQ